MILVFRAGSGTTDLSLLEPSRLDVALQDGAQSYRTQPNGPELTRAGVGNGGLGFNSPQIAHFPFPFLSLPFVHPALIILSFLSLYVASFLGGRDYGN